LFNTFFHIAWLTTIFNSLRQRVYANVYVLSKWNTNLNVSSKETVTQMEYTCFATALFAICHLSLDLMTIYSRRTILLRSWPTAATTLHSQTTVRPSVQFVKQGPQGAMYPTVNTVIRLWTRRSRNHISVPGKGNERFSLPNRTSRQAMGQIQPFVQRVRRDISSGVKRAGAWIWPQNSVYDVKNLWSYTSTRPYAFLARTGKHTSSPA